MKPSRHQKKILDWVKNGEGHLVTNAVAGSGKSSSLKMIVLELEKLGYTPNDIRICVFGKANSLDLVEKFGEKWKQSISTLHSIGWSTLKQHLSIKKPSDYKIDIKKYDKIAEGLGLEFEDKDSEDYLGKKTDFLKIVDLIRLTNKDSTPDNISDICQHFEISEIQDFDKVSIAVEKCLKLGKKSALSTKKIFDFTDQIWLPITWQLWKQDWFTTYSIVGIDESQDLNATQLELAVSLVGDRGRLIFVGDRNQSIYGFSGADCNSIETIIKRTSATELPLSTCYRCPKSHIKLVKDIFPSISIEAFSKNKEGNISSISDKQLEDKDFLITGDLLLGRRTSPLVKLCIKLISKGVSATVKGRAIGELLKSELREVVKIKPFDYRDFRSATDKYRSRKLEKWKDKENLDQLLESFEDRLAALIAIYESQINASTIKDLEDYIDTLFSDSPKRRSNDAISPVTLSTVHRAKGLEAERVFIIEPESLPLNWKNQNEWQLKQEYNLLYVALTRSKSDLFIVGQPRWMKRS